MTPINECSVHVCSTALSLQIPLQDRPAVVWSFAWSDPLSHGCSCTTNLVFSFKWKPPTFSTLAAMEVCGNLHQIYLDLRVSTGSSGPGHLPTNLFGTVLAVLFQCVHFHSLQICGTGARHVVTAQTICLRS